MANWWEVAWGLNPNNPADAHSWLTGNGSTAKDLHDKGAGAPPAGGNPAQWNGTPRYTLSQSADSQYHLRWVLETGAPADPETIVTIQRYGYGGWEVAATARLGDGQCDIDIPPVDDERRAGAWDGTGPAINEDFNHRLSGSVTSNESLCRIRLATNSSDAYRIYAQQAGPIPEPHPYRTSLGHDSETQELGSDPNVSGSLGYTRSFDDGTSRCEDLQYAVGAYPVKVASRWIKREEGQLLTADSLRSRYWMSCNDCGVRVPVTLAEWEYHYDPDTGEQDGPRVLIRTLTIAPGSSPGQTLETAHQGAVLSTGEGSTRVLEFLHAEMRVDRDRDGSMYFHDYMGWESVDGYTDEDITTPQRPYRFWLNNDHDVYHTVDGNDNEWDDASDTATWRDCNYTSIYTTRDLEDFTRLRITFRGITDLIKNTEYSVFLEWRAMDGAQTLPAADGAPEINVYQERQPDVRALYLEDETVASNQRGSSGGISYDTWIGGTKPGQPMNLFAMRPSLRTALSESNPTVNLLFCGKTAGRGQLILTIKKGGQLIGQYPPVYIELLDIKDMYERWTVGDGAGTDPEGLAQLTTRAQPSGYASHGHSRPFAYSASDPEEKKYILYVHGWNMKPEEKDQFAETAYKRLFWQGYKGRFGVFEWPTTYGFGALLTDDKKWKNGVNGIYSALSDPTNYDRGEWSAWRSALGLERQLIRLSRDYPGPVYMFAHSMGNVVAGEALRMLAQENRGTLVNTYVASQGALPAHCYQSNLSAPLEAQVPAEVLVRMFDGGYPKTPDIYGDWLAPNAAGAGRRINFYNVNDYALWQDVWQLNQYLKPDHSDTPDLDWTYRYVGNPATAPVEDGFRKDYYNPQNPGQDIRLHLGDATTVRDRFEIMSFAAESRSKALGGVSRVATITDNFDLHSIWPPDPAGAQRPYSAHKWHSAQFRSTNMRQKDYWKSLLGSQGFNITPQQP